MGKVAAFRAEPRANVMSAQPLLRSHTIRLAIGVLAVTLALLAGSEASGQAEPGGQLDSRLEQLIARAARGEIDPAASEVNGIEVSSGRVRVIVEVRGGFADGVQERARRLGGIVEISHDSLIQVEAPIGQLPMLASMPGVVKVRPPLRAYPVVTSQGVAQTNADDWQAAGLTGAGVKVAILDLGFQGYEARLGTELPPTVTTMSFVQGGDIYGGGEAHGVGVAEIVHDMAPDAELYLVNFSTEAELQDATIWLAGQGVQVINASWGYLTSGPGDGTGIVDGIVADSVNGGIFWSVAAGNWATSHWSGQFVDTDDNGFHEFSQSPWDEGNQLGVLFTLSAGEAAAGELRWNDPFGASCRDYDLFLMRTDDQGVAVPVASSENVQNDGSQCVPGADPVEVIETTVPVDDYYHWVIKKKVAATPATFDLYSALHDLRYSTAAGSIGQPADSPRVTTVGAVPYYSQNSIEAFSSRGPDAVGRVKPDVVAHDAVNNATFGLFFGTSAAAPHVAGAGALMLGVNPCMSPDMTADTIETHVVDLGTAGKDNTFGAGRLFLGATPADGDGDGVGDLCDNCPTAPNADQSNQDGDEYGDACEQPNCVTVVNHWTVAPGDADCDGYADSVAFGLRAPESFIGTDASSKCAATSTINDEPLPDAWPPDFNDNQLVNGADWLSYITKFGSTAPGPPYDARWDLNASGLINGADMLQLNPFFALRCVP